MRLYDLEVGRAARIVRVGGRGAFRKRILEMGFVAGRAVEMVARAPLGDPTRYRVMGYEVSLRASEAKLVEVELLASEQVLTPQGEASVGDDAARPTGNGHRFPRARGGRRPGDRAVRVALVGNPNGGKTSIFNQTSGSKERTGNYSGVTIESREAVISFQSQRIAITDLPGTYSLTAYSPEELCVRDFILEGNPDVIVNVIDATNLERSLYLTLQLLETGRPVVIALNMWDEFMARGDRLNRLLLSEVLGVSCVPTVGRTGLGLEQLWRAVLRAHAMGGESRPGPLQHYEVELQESAGRVRALIEGAGLRRRSGKAFSDYAFLKVLEGDAQVYETLRDVGADEKLMAQLSGEVQVLSERVGVEAETYVTDARYAFLSNLLRRAYAPAPAARRRGIKDRIDSVLTHRWLGLPIFFLLMWFMFWVTFTVGEIPMGWIEAGVAGLGGLVEGWMDPGPLRDLLVGGMIDGVGSVIVFLPQILLLFFFISLLEDSGYMARAVFLMDRAMAGIGLHGRSFIPLVMGFGCNVPAIMATRTIEDRKVRLVTMLITPFMSCSARLQVYILFVGAIFTSHPATVLMGLYLLGIIVAVGISFLFRRTILRGNDSPFVMELPPYRFPTFRAALSLMWDKGSQYLRKMGTVILLASIIIWFLGYYPRTTSQDAQYEAQIERLREVPMLTSSPDQTDSLHLEQEAELGRIMHEWEMLRQRESYLGRVGVALEPALLPLGLDWRVGISLLTGIAAKEVVVSTLGVLLQTGEGQDEYSPVLKERVKTVTFQQGPRQGERLFTPRSSLALLIFVVLYIPCVAVIAVIRREAGSWKWGIFAALYTTGVAYLVAFLVYQIGGLFV